MRLDDDSLRFSPTDLANFSACAQRSTLDRLRAHGRASAPKFDDPLLELLKEKGIEHERAYLESLRSDGRTIVDFPALTGAERTPAGYRHRAEETLAAMRTGADVIYQGTLYDGQWLGLVDFLLKVDTPSDLGDYSYEVLDAKLAREAKSMAVLQCCVYSDLLEPVQGHAPERIHLYLGGPRPHQQSFRLAHFAAYYRALKRRFLEHVETAPDEPDPAPVAPDPVDFCRICDWKTRCQDERRDVDHLSLVAGIARDHRRALEALNVTTLEGLAELPLEPPPDGLRATSFERIREQARVQLEGRRRNAPYHELLDLQHDEAGEPLGLGALPEPSSHDWFFDFESASLAGDEGLEYLWGITDAHDTYRCDWAFTPAEEKTALERFLTEALAHIESHRDAHIFHFGHKETSTLKRLVGRYGVGTDELDTLLKRRTFVDLYRVVKQGLIASVERYSLKPLEAVFGFERTVALNDANRARGALEAGLAQGADRESLEDTLPVVRGYNLDDCVSTRVLRDWLEARRTELEARRGEPIARPTPPDPDEETEPEVAEEVRRLMEGLLAEVPDDAEERTPEQHVRWLMAHLLEWHRREDKTAWWDYFRMMAMSSEELVVESKPLGGLEYEGVVGAVKRSLVHRFRYPPQEHRLSDGDSAVDPAYTETTKRWSVYAVDASAGVIDLKVGKASGPEILAEVRALIPEEVVPSGDQKSRLRQTADRLLQGQTELDGWSPASLALLRRDRPRFQGGYTLPEAPPLEGLLQHCRDAVVALDRSVLAVQGPPGTGKTYSGARMIRALLRRGLRVGVTAGSHKVITNLLNAVCDADSDDEPTTIVGLQITNRDGCTDDRFRAVKSKDVPGLLEDGVDDGEGGTLVANLVAGTAWPWSREDYYASVDVLFIDEAGQFSLANALAVAPVGRSLVLLGDPQQLNQPQKGTHPPGTEVSVLEHLAGDDGILTPDRGLFLGETWRMRPEINAFTSELFYGGKLKARPHLVGQRLVGSEGEELHGLFHVPVAHSGNSRESIEEAEALVKLFRELLDGRTAYTDVNGDTRPLDLGDLLVVAPYNAQVDRIRATLVAAGYDDPHVGTVDKFQGQEAPVAIYSLASSSADDAPRGMGFLYALDRLNVATSRARCATIVVSSRAVFEAECRTPEQIRMVNAFLRYGEMGRTRQQD